jgi:hypothetical protein
MSDIFHAWDCFLKCYLRRWYFHPMRHWIDFFSKIFINQFRPTIFSKISSLSLLSFNILTLFIISCIAAGDSLINF